jgi:hypothetical protein
MSHTFATRPAGPASALGLLCLCAGALLAGCAAGAHPQRPLPAPPATGAAPPVVPLEQAAPLRRLATAYGPGSPGGSVSPAGPAPARPGPRTRARVRPAAGRAAAPDAAPAGARSEVRQQPDYGGTPCELAERYGSWAEGSAEDDSCVSLYG